MKTVRTLLALILMAATFCACANTRPSDLKDGYYSAEAATYDEHGWKEFVTIFVSNSRIAAVEYNAQNASGFIKSWDNEYMRVMNQINGTYPNKYARAYAADLLFRQNPSKVDTIAGATHSCISFKLLAEAAIEQARTGDKNVASVPIPIPE